MMENEVARRLREDAIEIDRSLDEFMRNRMECVEAQQRALDEYNEEIARIADEHEGIEEEIQPEIARTDHNLNRHLNISNKANYQPEDEEYPAYGEGSDYYDDAGQTRFPRNYVDVPKKEYFDKGLTPKPSIPNAEMKEKMREAVFSMLETSQTEEMQVLLE